MPPQLLLAREVVLAGPAGPLVFGGRAPIVTQTMTVAATERTEAVSAEICELAAAGAELVRVTVQSPRIAASLAPLRAKLDAAGVRVPLVADIHFSPEAALRAADFVEKLRINPGNFADTRKPRSAPYTDAEYAAELARVGERLLPLVESCKRQGRVLRIGSNHGSLSQRILSRYGDTPLGMVEAALEYVRLAESAGYRELVISMKASHVGVMVEAYRLLALAMLRRAEAGEGEVYPVHLGVTEAGEGEDARLKSYIGMGSLLELGIGDTVRVSLTENALEELPAARALAERYSDRRHVAEPWTAASLSAEFAAREADPATGALPHDDALSGLDPEARAKHFPVTLVPVHWQPAIQDLLALRWRPLPPDHVRTDELGRLGLVVVPRGISARLAEPRLEPAARERTLLELAVGAGIPLLEGLARRVAVEASSGEEALRGVELGYALLQTTRLRMSRADFISCPSCGRTHFDLQTATRRIRERFGHLEGIKIAIMGCVVNGPGEMADADFGYVGAAPGRIDLYRGRECLERGIPEAQAVDRLQALLAQHGIWREPTGKKEQR
ncbi:(E)-4-hydroxy-3-methylbut-2-enyl-diphosphate synthase [bacterium]|nr:(E)-4-hydroxy-3-methylbut-2-enyl-diphosphate synthase [bacterium]